MKLHPFWVGCALLAATLGQAPAQTQIDLRTQSKSVDFSNATSTKPSKTGTALPATCSVGEMFLNTSAGAGANIYVCTAANVWTAQGGSMPAYQSGAYGKILANDTDGMQWESLSGDVAGDPDALTVTGLQGNQVSPGTPSSGQVLSWNGTQWTPQPPLMGSVFGRTGTVTAQTGDYAAAQITNAVDRTAATTYAAGATQAFVAGTTSGLRVTPGGLPGAPQAGDFAVDASDTNRAKVFNGSAWVSLNAVPNYFTSFTSATSVTVPGTVHNLNTANLVVECYDNGTPEAIVEPDRVRIDPNTYDVTVTFAVPQTGRLVINAAGGGSSNGADASAALDFPNIAAGSCAAEQTFPLAGAVPGDEIAPGWPGGLEAGLIGMMRVTTAGTVSVRICNLSGAPVDPASATFSARLVRNY